MKLEEVELLKWKNLQLEEQLAGQARQHYVVQLFHKYGLPGETTINVGPDGTILRPPALEPPKED